jgi:hypothetical protein
VKTGKDMRKKNQAGGVVKLVASGELHVALGYEFDRAGAGCGLCDII